MASEQCRNHRLLLYWFLLKWCLAWSWFLKNPKYCLRNHFRGKNPLTPIPLHFPLPFNALPLSTSATQAILNYDHRKKSSDLNDRRDYMETSLYNRLHLKDMFYMYLSFALARNVSRTLIKRIQLVQINQGHKFFIWCRKYHLPFVLP